MHTLALSSGLTANEEKHALTSFGDTHFLPDITVHGSTGRAGTIWAEENPNPNTNTNTTLDANRGHDDQLTGLDIVSLAAPTQEQRRPSLSRVANTQRRELRVAYGHEVHFDVAGPYLRQ